MIRTAGELRRAMEAGALSAEALAAESLSRIAETNDAWRIFTAVREAEAVAADARASDARRKAGQLLGKLDGIPIAVKDNIDVAGMSTFAGTRHDFGGPAARDASVVARLRAAGAIIVGKLNMHEGALGATTDNPFWGRCENPAAPGHTPGGSSGGSGAAIAGGLVPIALGTDTMGSVRIPAAYCGAWGLKPTKGLVGNSGLAYLAWDLDTIGPLAASAEDLAAAIEVMAGLDRDDADSLAPPAGWTVAPGALQRGLAGVPLGYVDAAALTQCEDAVLVAYRATLDAAKAAGAQLHPVDLTALDLGRARRHGLLISEAQAGSLLADALKTEPASFSEGFRKLLDYGRAASAERLARAHWDLRAMKVACLQALEGLSAILLPTVPQPAFLHGSPAPANQADFTALANFAGLPSLAFPVSVAGGSLPLSVQCMGHPFSEGLLLEIARLLAAQQDNKDGQA